MIRGEHGAIRTSQVDDAAAFKGLYACALPRAPLLDARQEWAVPTLEELRQALGTASVEHFSGLNTIEDLTGSIVGFCGLRRSKTDPLFAQLSVMFFEDETYSTPLAREVGDYLLGDAFRSKLIQKLMTLCLGHERACREYVCGLGFSSDGVQREVLYTAGRWHNLESFSLMNGAGARVAEGAHEAIDR